MIPAAIASHTIWNEIVTYFLDKSAAELDDTEIVTKEIYWFTTKVITKALYNLS